MNEFEIPIVKYFNKLGGKKTDVFLGFINSIRFLTVFWLVLIAVAVLRHPNIAHQFLIAVCIVAILHFAVTEAFIKHFLTRWYPLRKRPYVAYPDSVKPIGKKFSDSSFPSSHVATTAAMLMVIAAFYPSLTIPAMILIIVIAFSRLHNGMHYPSDIVAGALLGIGYGYAALSLLTYIV